MVEEGESWNDKAVRTFMEWRRDTGGRGGEREEERGREGERVKAEGEKERESEGKERE